MDSLENNESNGPSLSRKRGMNCPFLPPPNSLSPPRSLALIIHYSSVTHSSDRLTPDKCFSV